MSRIAYYSVILSFADTDTARLFQEDLCPPQWRAFKAVALRKLDQLDAAVQLGDLASPPGNRLEALKGDRKGQYSIRVNDQWRVCFCWSSDGPLDVVIVDYH